MLTARLLTILCLIGFSGAVLILVVLAWLHHRNVGPPDRTSTSPRDANKWLRRMGTLFILPLLALIGIHGYWALLVAGPLDEDQQFIQSEQRRDARHRRIEESGLRGWIFDRHGGVSTGLAGYRMDDDEMERTYMIANDAIHVVGYSSLLRSRSGAELAYDGRLRSNLSSWKLQVNQDVVGDDVTLTLDRGLQSLAAKQLRQTNKPGAIVVVQVSTGDILAMASFPDFDPHRVDTDELWNQLRTDPSRPFINRALNQYYLPGSTFKVIVAAAALSQGLTNPTFVCSASGYRPAGGTKVIYDDRGPGEVHGQIGLADALRVSCNQYFAQLGVNLGFEKLAAATQQFGFHIDATPEQARERYFNGALWANSEAAFQRIFSPDASRLVLSKQTSAVDIAFQAYGQGFVQVTPLHMALVATAVANRGQMMAARLDFFHEPQKLQRVMSVEAAESLTDMMLAVTERPGGTAVRAFSGLRSRGVHTAGKTGTAQFALGDKPRVDSWFIGFAPADDPQIAFAVVVEGGRYGSETAAPMAATLVEAARQADFFREKNPTPPSTTRAERR